MQANNSNPPSEKPNGHAADLPPGPEFAIQRIYAKDLSFESPNSPQLFLEPLQLTTDVELNIKTAKLVEDVFEVELVVTVTTKNQQKVAFLAEVHQAGIFGIKGFNEGQIHRMLGTYCPNILFPYVRETISDLINRGGFPPIYLAPINFEGLYEQQMQQQQTQANKDTNAEETKQ